MGDVLYRGSAGPPTNLSGDFWFAKYDIRMEQVGKWS